MEDTPGQEKGILPCQTSCLRAHLLPSETCDIPAFSGMHSCKTCPLRFPLPGTAERKEIAVHRNRQRPHPEVPETQNRETGWLRRSRTRARGTGHAGRRQLVRTAMLAACLAMAALVIGLMNPKAAKAYSGSVTWNYDPTNLITDFYGSDGSRGYCAQAEKAGPQGTYTEWHWVSEMDSGTLRGDPHGLSWLIAQCYPLNSTFSGQTLDAKGAATVSQAAIWMYQGDLTKDRHEERRGLTVNSCTQEQADLAWTLAQEAHTHDGEAGSWDHVAKFWVSPNGGRQNIIAIPPYGSLAVTKQSAETLVSVSGTGYSLEGAEFGLYLDQACTQEVESFTTDAEGNGKTGLVAEGTYYLKEKKAPKGFLVSQDVLEIAMAGGQEIHTEVPEQPRYSVPDILIKKQDAETGGEAEGDATFEGAEFTATFYPEGTDTSGTPERTWTIRCDADGTARLDDAHKVSGDDWYRKQDGTIVLPLGTLVVEETKAPSGYRLPGNSRQEFRIAADDSAPTGATILQPATVEEEVMRGGIAVQKVDAESKSASPKGKAVLSGAVFEIVNASRHAVVVGGTSYAPGEAVTTIETDSTGRAATAADALPFGTYTVHETKAPEGYLLNSDWEKTVSITEDGKILELQGDDACADQVKRGDLSFVKEDGTTSARMADIPFKITSKTTGEWHIAVTDANGILDTAAAQYPHTQSTNANDAAVKDDGAFDDTKIVRDAGVWFAGTKDGSSDPDDSKGALPYDVYTIEELSSPANAGKKLVSFEATITRDAFGVHLGTVTNEEGPHIETTLTDEEGEHIVPATDETFTLVDTVAYANLEPGKIYELTGTLMDHDTGEALPYAEPVTTNFTPASESGTTEVTFIVTGLPSSVKRIVAFESLKEEGKEIAVHADIEDEGQSVRFSELHTTAAESGSGSHTLKAADAAELTDTVSYTGLIPNETYTLTATLHVVDSKGNDGGALVNSAGETITFTKDFVTESEDGTVDVPIEFNAQNLAGTKIVVFEELTHKGHVVGKHEDIHDEGQTVVFEETGVPDTSDTSSVAWGAFALAGIAALVGGIWVRSRH